MTNQELKINIYNEVGGRAAVTATDGEKIYKKILTAINNNTNVILDFINIEIVASAFLNTAIGQLYKEKFSPEQLKTLVKAVNIEKEDTELLKQVLSRAKEYYQNPEYKERLIEVLNEELDSNECN